MMFFFGAKTNPGDDSYVVPISISNFVAKKQDGDTWAAGLSFTWIDDDGSDRTDNYIMGASPDSRDAMTELSHKLEQMLIGLRKAIVSWDEYE